MSNYDSKLSTFLRRLFDLCAVNILFLLSCVPCLTYGAAKTALYSCAVRWEKNEDAGTKEYFRYFKENLKTGILPGIVILILALILYVDINISFMGEGNTVLIVISVLVVFVFFLYKEQLFLFHARLVSPKADLYRNGFLVTFAYPLRALFSAIPTAVAVILFFAFPVTFAKITPAFILFYYSLSAFVTVRIMKKPYEKIVQQIDSEK